MYNTRGIDRPYIATSLYWWQKPHSLIIGFIVPIYCLLTTLGPPQHVTVKKTFITVEYGLAGLGFLLVLSLGAWLGWRTKYKRGGINFGKLNFDDVYLDVTALLTITGYTVWFGRFMSQPELIARVLSISYSGAGGLKPYFDTIPGVTTLSQIGVIYIILYLYRRIYAVRMPTRFSLYTYVIMAFTFMRVVLWAERLALLEVAIPVVLIVVSVSGVKRIVSTYVLRAAPFLGIGALAVYFGVAELFRSWWAYRSTYDTIVEFTVSRLYAYYWTSINNGIGFVKLSENGNVPLGYVLKWLYEFPVVGEYLKGIAGQPKGLTTGEFLRNYADPEFINMSAMFLYMYDLGVVGSFVLAMCLGYVLGSLCGMFHYGHTMGMLLYPAMYVSLLELLRIPYLSLPRFFPIVVFSLVIYFSVSASRVRGNVKGSL
ncbi:hypothetical protein [Salinibacter ruber]|uniref:hypothetical protein n=1 Tax=Salinibacter ruber TaxID=146919 RepID=UPI00216777D0|nr:hypothetical protein [Salinibacter ruber]MCS4039510.1 hypothetical protein [Salinibacter ruber]